MWLCSGCEKVPPEAIRFIGKYSELRVHWFCKMCDKLAIDAVISHMSNQLLSKEISSCLNDTVVESLNKVVESVAETLKETQSSLSDLCKTLESKALAPSFTAAATEAGNRDGKESVITSKCELFPSVLGKQVVNIVNEISDQDRRRCNLMVHNLPEPKQPSAQERTSSNTKSS